MLGDIVAQEPDSIDAALERYERQRKPDVHALGTMDHQVFTPNSLSPSLNCKLPYTERFYAWQCDGLIWYRRAIRER